MKAYPAVREFIDQHAELFANLEVAYPNGQKPQLVLLGEQGESETLSVTGWNTETLKDYLKENLAPA